MVASCRPKLLSLRRPRARHTLRHFLRPCRLAACLVPAAAVGGLLYQPTIVDGPSMEPTLAQGQLIWTDRTHYWRNRPQVGEVVVFRAGRDVYVKRVYALPGEIVYFLGGGERTVPVRQSKVLECLQRWHDAAAPSPLRVPDGCVYVLGDNIVASIDSRALGPIPIRSLLGRARVPADVTRCRDLEYVPPAPPPTLARKRGPAPRHASSVSAL